MKKDIFDRRHWAETVRLYSGLLENPERIEFIKTLALDNILLAAECQAISFTEEEELTIFLTPIAIESARMFNHSKTSARGIMALAELNKFDEIANIFSLISETTTSEIHNKVVVNYIANGSESQISLFLSILYRTNKRLLSKALDRVFDLGVAFNNSSINTLLPIIDDMIGSEQVLLASKLLCIIQLKKDNINANYYLDILLDKHYIKFAISFIEIYGIRPQSSIVKYLNEYVKSNVNQWAIISFLELCKQFNYIEDWEPIRLLLSTHLNPRVKNLILDAGRYGVLNISEVKRICIANIKIANRSSIEFALKLRTLYHLENILSIDLILDNLLIENRPQRLELAYKLIVDYDLYEKYPYEHLYYLLLNTLNLESLNLARSIVLQHLYDNKKLLELLACISSIETSNQKLAKEILIQDLSRDSIPNPDKIYYGSVINIRQGNYSIAFLDNQQITIPRNISGYLKIGSIIKFSAIRNSETDNWSLIKIITKELQKTLFNKFYYGQYWIGQILILKIIRYNSFDIFLGESRNDEFSFKVTRNEYNECYYSGSLPRIGDSLRIRIDKFDKRKRLIWCNCKYLEIKHFDDGFWSEESFKQKISALQQRFKN